MIAKSIGEVGCNWVISGRVRNFRQKTLLVLLDRLLGDGQEQGDEMKIKLRINGDRHVLTHIFHRICPFRALNSPLSFGRRRRKKAPRKQRSREE